jgi:hypothetical protein
VQPLEILMHMTSSETIRGA